MHACQPLAPFTIFFSAFGMGACSGSNPASSAMGGGGTISANGGSSSGGASTVTGAGGFALGAGGAVTGAGGTGGSTSPAGTGGSTASCHAAGTLNVTNQAMTAYLIDETANPTLTFCRGSTYTFAVNASGHPFYIKTVQSTGTANAYNTGVTGNGSDTGNVTFVVDSTAPSTLFYDCSIHAAMAGVINIVN